MSEATLREDLCFWARSLFDRGLTGGGSGNISVRTPDGGLLVTPTGASFGRLDPARLSKLDAGGAHIGGDRPTKEMPLHAAFYDTRPGTGAVVHLHSTHATALSMLPDVDPDDAVPPLTPYLVMRVGRVALLPFFVPGDDAMADAVRALGGRARRCCWRITARWWRAPRWRRRCSPWRSWRRRRGWRCCCAGPGRGRCRRIRSRR